MIKLDPATVEVELIKLIEDINVTLKIGAKVTGATCPGSAGFSSQILIDMFPAIEDALGIKIPHNQYIFFDKVKKQLSIKDAVQKLIKVAKDGK